MSLETFDSTYIADRLKEHLKWLRSSGVVDGKIIAREGKQWQDAQGFVQNITFSGEIFSGVELYECTFQDVMFKECDLSYAIFNGNTFVDCSFISCNLYKAELNHAELHHTSFTGCSLVRAEFILSDMNRVELEDCTIGRTAFINTAIADSIFRRCEIRNIRLNKAKLLNTKISAVGSYTYEGPHIICLSEDGTQSYAGDDAVKALLANHQLEILEASTQDGDGN